MKGPGRDVRALFRCVLNSIIHYTTKQNTVFNTKQESEIDMPRPQIIPTEEIIAKAEDLAAHRGWQSIYGTTVQAAFEGDPRGKGSASTFTKIISAWRSQKSEQEAQQAKPQAIEVSAPDRATPIDPILYDLGEKLSAIRSLFTSEIDKSVQEERRRGERARQDDQEAFSAKNQELRENIAQLQAETASLLAEVEEEQDRSEQAEAQAKAKDAQISELEVGRENLSQELSKAKKEAEELAEALDRAQHDFAIANDQVKKADAHAERERSRADEERKRADAIDLKANEAMAQMKAQHDAEIALKVEEINRERARADSIQSRADEQVEQAQVEARASTERADQAWSQVKELTAKLAEIEKSLLKERNPAQKLTAAHGA